MRRGTAARRRWVGQPASHRARTAAVGRQAAERVVATAELGSKSCSCGSVLYRVYASNWSWFTSQQSGLVRDFNFVRRRRRRAFYLYHYVKRFDIDSFLPSLPPKSSQTDRSVSHSGCPPSRRCISFLPSSFILLLLPRPRLRRVFELAREARLRRRPRPLPPSPFPPPPPPRPPAARLVFPLSPRASDCLTDCLSLTWAAGWAVGSFFSLSLTQLFPLKR